MPPKRGKKRTAAQSKSKPPAKLSREDSDNTKLRKAIGELKSSSSEKKTYKPDATFLDEFGTGLKVVDDFACMLNQTNIGHNNNKYYVIQVGNCNGKFMCFTKWGRVGEPGQNQLFKVSSRDEAIKIFKKKFTDKTKNQWENRDNFIPYTGKYTLLEMGDESDEEEEETPELTLQPLPDKLPVAIGIHCTLHLRTQLLIKIIFNKDMFTNQMSNMELDVKKMPLGKLSKKQIAKGLEALLEIEDALKKNKGRQELSRLTSVFYTLIPHNFGRTVPPVIDNMDIINKKKEVMMTLSDIELAQSLQAEKAADPLKLHPLDEQYEKLGCVLTLLGKSSKEFKLAEKYATACPNTRTCKLLDVWEVDRKGESQRFAAHDGIKNRKLLWHGTNVAVVAAILNSGLRIMPHSGGRVGKGIYFASEHAKSSWYVSAHCGMFEQENNVGFMFLVEVVLGKEFHITRDQHFTAAPKGYDSVVARGHTEPDPKMDVKVKMDGKEVVVAVGKPIQQNDFTTSNFSQSEYLVYRESQAKIRYLLKFSF